jgi:Chaperone of endosialidase
VSCGVFTQTQGALHVGEDSFVAGSLTVGGSVQGGGPYMDSSDARFKTAVSTVTDALATVRQLRGVTYDWDGASHPSRGFPPGRQVCACVYTVTACFLLLAVSSVHTVPLP